MKTLDQYFALQAEIYAYFGYVEDWVVIPLEDSRDYWWRLNAGSFTPDDPDTVEYASSIEELKEERDEYYCNAIYKQRFLPKWVYRGPEFTMVVVDTQTDGNKFLQIFDNAKEVKRMIDQLHALAHGSIPPKSDYRLFHGLPPHARERRGSRGPVCPQCRYAQTLVLGKDGANRRRACVQCHHRFTTVEVYLP